MTYEEPRKCAYCNSDKRWVPPGISKKTGKAYDGFWVCDKCKPTPKQNTGQTILFDQIDALRNDVEKIKKWLKDKYNLEQ